VPLQRSDVLPLAGLSVLGSLAFIHRMALPVFEDEGSQVRWIYRIIDAHEWTLPLFDGKPLEAWPMVPLVQMGLSPLSAMRGLHVVAGIIGAILVYLLALHVIERRWAFACGALFAISPFTVYLERLALSDIFMSTSAVWVMLNVLAFTQIPSARRAVLLAASLLLVAISKFPIGFEMLVAVPLALLLMPEAARRPLLMQPALGKLAAAQMPALLLLLLVIGVAIFRLRRGHAPGFGIQDFIGIGLGQYRELAASIGVSRPTLLGELNAQLTWPVTAAGAVGLIGAAVLGEWRQRWLIAMGVIPLLAIALFARFWYSRYLLFALPPLLIAAVWGWRSLLSMAPVPLRAGGIALLGLCAVLMVRQSALLIGDPAAAHWSPLDRFQYVAGWGSGYGYEEAARYILNSPAAPAIYSLDGHSAYQLLAYLPRQWRGRVGSADYDANGTLLSSPAERLANLALRAPVWLVVSKQLLARYLDASLGHAYADRVQVREIAEFAKPDGRTQLALYQLDARRQNR
jgi:4-amino-4-deoxy-L-arabinose transferase-like glycosyltransferase